MRRRHLAAAIVGIVAICAIAEASARALEPRLSSSGTFPPGSMASQYDAIAAAERRGDRIDVVIAGSSMTARAIEAETFSRLTDTTAVNVALPEFSNVMLGPWLVDIVAPKLKPKHVIIGVASRDFNDGNADYEAYRTLLSSPGVRDPAFTDTLGKIDGGVSDWSAFVRVRRSLRAPGDVVQALTDPIRPRFSHACLSSHPSEGTYRNKAFLRRYPTSWFKDYSTGGVQTEALEDAIQRLDEAGIDVWLLKLPMSKDYRDAHTGGPADIEAFEDAFDRTVETTDVHVLDAFRTLDTDLYRDPLHFNCDGADAFTHTLADAWNGRGDTDVVRLPKTEL